MKRNLTKAVLVLLAVIMALVVFVACDDNAQTFSVTIMDGETTLATYSVTDGALPDYSAKVAKEDYVFKGLYTDKDLTEEFDADAVIAADLTLYVKYEKVKYTITVNSNGGSEIASVSVAYGDPIAIAEPERDGYEFLGYTYLDANEVKQVFEFETYPFKNNIRITANWWKSSDEDAVDFDASTATFVKKDTYFKERATADDEFTYVFLTGRTYDFGASTISTTNGYEYISLRSVNGTNDSFAANKATVGDATFTLTVTPVLGGEAKTIKARIVESVNTFGIGADFNAMLANAAEEKGLFQVATTNADYVMDIGNGNFIPDIIVTSLGGSDITLSAANVKVTLGDTDVTAALTGNVLNLAANLITGDVKTLTFAPKYALAADNIKAVSFKVKVNGGVNVYTNEELMSAYANTGVSCVNVLRNITAVLPAGEYYSDYGKVGDIPLYDADGNVTATLKDWDLGVPHNWYGGGVYRRTTNNQADNIVINGNYFTIDGSKLPYISDYSSRTAGLAYKLMESQIGIFMYRCADIDYTGQKRDITRRYAGGTASINNLRIVSNASPDLAIAEEPIAGMTEKLLKMSASFIGIVVRGGTMNLENTSIVNAEQGLMLDGGVSGYGNDDAYKPGASEKWSYDANETQSVHLNVNNSLFSGCWANDVYIYNLAALSFKNTKLGSCNGAALLFDDKAYAKVTVTKDEETEAITSAVPDSGNFANTCGYSNLNSSLTMDIYSAKNLKNWVVGEEAWFVAYNRTKDAKDIKTGIENGVKGNGCTILKESATGEMMNFAILVMSDSDFSGDKDGRVMIDIQTKLALQANPIFAMVVPYGDASDEATIDAAFGAAGLPGYFGVSQVYSSYIVNSNMQLYLPVYVQGMVD